MTWPPSARELDHFDVVDVPEDQRLQAAATTDASDARPAPAPTSGPGFERPDWGELRLRGPVDETTGVSRWWQAVAMALALVAVAEGGYIWRLRASTAAGAGQARLRVDGPAGAEVRIDGRTIGVAPIDHPLAPGAYDVQIVQGATMQRTPRVTVDAGRTTVMWTAATGTPADVPAAAAASSARETASTSSVPAVAPPGSIAEGTRRAVNGPADAVSATLGAVLIESTPAGLPVTMEGRPRGVTPITIGRLKPGRHDVLVGGLARQVDVAANATATLRVTRR